MPELLEVRQLSAGYGPLRVLHEIDLTVSAGERLGLVGLNGHGKTTLLRCIAGLEKEVSGRIELADVVWLDQDKNIPSQQRNIGYVFQDSRLFPHLSVADNRAYGMRRQNRAGEVIDSEYELGLGLRLSLGGTNWMFDIGATGYQEVEGVKVVNESPYDDDTVKYRAFDLGHLGRIVLGCPPDPHQGATHDGLDVFQTLDACF